MKRLLVVLLILILVVSNNVVGYSATSDIYPNEYVDLFDRMSREDWDYLAKCAMCEAGHSNLECCAGTICVILNRVLNQRTFKNVNTVKEVVLQKGQFSTRPYFDRAKPNQLVYESIAYVQNHGAEIIRNKLSENGWDLPSTSYVYFSVGKQKRYADNFLMIGTEDRGQHHWIGTEKMSLEEWSLWYCDFYSDNLVE